MARARPRGRLGAVSGQGGHGATWRVTVALIRGFDLGEDLAFELLCDFSARCEPPWSERELRHKVASAVRDARLEASYLLTEARP